MRTTAKWGRGLHQMLSKKVDTRRAHSGSLLCFLLILNLVCLCWTHPTYAEWSSLGPAGSAIYSIAIDPVDTKIIYTGTSDGVLKSTNGGASWSSVNNRPDNLPSLIVPTLKRGNDEMPERW